MERHLATVTYIGGGIAKCDECGEVMLEDERHLHADEETDQMETEEREM